MDFRDDLSRQTVIDALLGYFGCSWDQGFGENTYATWNQDVDSYTGGFFDDPTADSYDTIIYDDPAADTYDQSTE